MAAENSESPTTPPAPVPAPAPVRPPAEQSAARAAQLVRGRPADSQTDVELLAADLAAVASLVPKGRESDVTRALAKGAAGALALAPAGLRPRRTCHVRACDLVALLEAAGVHAQ
jgi:hypothetical protein